jgi:hypothetical protein
VQCSLDVEESRDRDNETILRLLKDKEDFVSNNRTIGL